MTILDTSGNVGIGTTSPTAKLVIDGGGDADADAGDASEYSLLINQDNNDKGIAFGFNGADNKIGAAIIAKGSGYNSNNKTDLQFYVKGTTGTTAPSNVMTLQAGGNVGIGEDDVDARFHISTASSGLVNQKFESSGSSAWRVGIPAGQTYFAFDDSSDDLSSPEVVFTTAGKVGIGTTSPAFGLQIDGADFSGDAFKITRGTSAFTILNANNDYGVLGMESDHDLQIRTNGTTRMTIDNDGKVGIGITPSANLDVAGSGGSDGAAGSPTIRLSNTVASGDWDTGDVVGTIEYYAHDTSGNAPYVTSFIKSVNETNNGTLPGGALTFGVADYDASGGAAEAMRINEDGKVGIGTTSPSFKLKVNVDNGTYTDWETIAAFQTKRSADSETEAGIMINSLGDALGGQISSNYYWSDNVAARGNTGRSGAIFGMANNAGAAGTHSSFYWQTAPNNSNTLTDRMELDTNGNLKLFDNTANPSEDMAFAYHSTKSTPEGKLKKVNVDMMKLARLVEQLTGEKLVYIEEEGE